MSIKPIDFVVFEGDSSPNQPVYKVAEAMQKNMLVYVGIDECEVVGYHYSEEHQAMVLELEMKEIKTQFKHQDYTMTLGEKK